MFPCAFDEENDVANGSGPVESISVFRGEMEDGLPVVISCWKLTAEELAEVNRTGRVWVLLLGHKMHPLAVDGTSPFVRKAT